MDVTVQRCDLCQLPGTTSQGPWPLPITACYCNKCWKLETQAFLYWKRLYPTLSKFNCPVPLLRPMDIPTLPLRTSEVGTYLLENDELKAVIEKRMEAEEERLKMMPNSIEFTIEEGKWYQSPMSWAEWHNLQK